MQKEIYMRILKYAILGLINRQPVAGYNILKEFSDYIFLDIISI